MNVDELVELLLVEARTAIGARGRFDIVFPGGDTPQPLFVALADRLVDADAWHVYLSDERCLAAGDPDRNDVPLRSMLLDRVTPPVADFVTPRAELDPETAVEQFDQELSRAPTFDVAVLGLGDDGHTASLFPGGPGRSGGDTAVAVHDAPKPPRRRISMSASRLSDTRLVIFLVRAGTKKWARRSLLTGGPIPANDVHGHYRMLVELDASTAG